MSEAENLDRAFVDVRRAYRLLWLFQRRGLDLLSEIARNVGHTFYVWSPIGYDPPTKRGNDPAKNWALDMLPMYKFSKLYLPENFEDNRPRKGEWMLDLCLTADTGLPSLSGSNYQEFDPMTFRAPEECRTTLAVWVLYCTKTISRNWVSGMWEEAKYPQFGELLKTPLGFNVVGREYNLSELGNKAAIDGVATDIRDLVGRASQT
jgi:hypothetical protein